MIPPTRAALEEHVQRPAYQGGHVWGMIPPTRAALEEHVQRPAYQGGHMGYDTTNQGSSGGACPEASLLGRPCGV